MHSRGVHGVELGRLMSMMATVSPGPTPSRARPRSIDSTRAPYSLQEIGTPRPTSRIATRSGTRAMVCWNSAGNDASAVRSRSATGGACTF